MREEREERRERRERRDRRERRERERERDVRDRRRGMSESKQLKQSNGGGHRTPDSHPDPDPRPTRATATEGSELALRTKNHGPSIANEDTRWLERKDLQLVKRDDVKKHSHKNVWTKDPHGGRYRLCTGPDAAKGYDALEERPDRTKVNTDPGYEKPQVSKT